MFLSLILTLAVALQPIAQIKSPTAIRQTNARTEVDRRIAAALAPVIYQGLGDHPRADYLTNFDFDGDWKGDNNWKNLDNKTFPLKAYVYFSVIETTTHYYVHYAFFHPRDYKGGMLKTALVETLIAEGVRRAGTDPTGLANDVALSHENDLEGCLVVAEKHGTDAAKATVQYVEAMGHNRYLKYLAKPAQRNEVVDLEGQHPFLFAEPKGHGVSRYTGSRDQLKNCVNGTMVYRYTGSADDPETSQGKEVGYDLVAISETLWPRAQKGDNETYAEVEKFAEQKVSVLSAGNQIVSVSPELGQLGAAFRGNVGFKNKARPPWGWYDEMEKERPRGEWFFDPANVIARHFNLPESFSRVYVYNPYLKIGVK